MSTMMVTGGLGFVGRHLVSMLVADGSRVVSYNRDYSTSEDAEVTAVQGELFDIPRLLRALQEQQVDRIIHTAGMSDPLASIELPLTTFAANVQGTLSLLEAARMAGVRRVVNFSSECAYGDQDCELVREDVRLRPLTPYGVTKVATELLGDVYTRLYGVEVISLRIGEIYGSRSTMPGYLIDLVSTVARGRPYRLAEGGDHPFNWVHVEDVCRGARAAATVPRPEQGVYNIAGGRQATLNEAAQIVRRIFPEADIEIGGGFIQDLDRQGPWDISAAARDLAYRPSWRLEDGITQLAASMNEKG
jgi:UDP-glucose 4-epimerase